MGYSHLDVSEGKKAHAKSNSIVRGGGLMSVITGSSLSFGGNKADTKSTSIVRGGGLRSVITGSSLGSEGNKALTKSTSIMGTLASVPWVSVLKRFD